jgi:4-methylaminobutanoate oxidase (formaldehyde-forming)
MGELGYELYIPTEFACHVYDTLIEVGQSFGLQHCGYHTLQSLRIEKAYREFGHDLGADDTPLEAGLGFCCDFNKPDGFIGKNALVEQKAQGITKRLAQFKLRDSEPMMYHNEPIYRNGELVGYTSSAMYGHSLGAAVSLGYVKCDDGVTPEWIKSGSYQIEVAGNRYAADVSLAPLYDPKALRVKQ